MEIGNWKLILIFNENGVLKLWKKNWWKMIGKCKTFSDNEISKRSKWFLM